MANKGKSDKGTWKKGDVVFTKVVFDGKVVKQPSSKGNVKEKEKKSK